jgi:O-antigen ligase
MRRTLTFRLVLLLTASLPLESVYAVSGSASITKLLGVLAAMAWASTVLTARRVRAPHALHGVALLFVLWNACSLLWTVDGPATQTRVLTYAQLFVLLLVVWETVTTTAQMRQVLLADLVGCHVAAVTMVAGYVVQGTGAEVHGRVTLGSFNPNDAGVLFALGLPVACFLLAGPWPGPWRRLVRVLAATYLPLGAVAVLGTGSRAALAALVPTVWYAGRLLGRRHPVLPVATFVGLGALTVAVLPLLPATARDRLLQSTLNERQDVWSEAIRIIGDRPLGGAGAGSFRTAATGVNKVGHNFVLALLAEIGVVGLALFVLIIVVALRALRPAPRALREMWLTFFAAWLFAALLHNWEYRKLTWLMFVLMAACETLPGPTAAGGDGEAESEPAPTARAPDPPAARPGPGRPA